MNEEDERMKGRMNEWIPATWIKKMNERMNPCYLNEGQSINLHVA